MTVTAWPSNDDLLGGLITATRLIGEAPELVLHGGGNSSLKSEHGDVTGRNISVLHMKASGSDMAQASPSGFAMLRLERLRELLASELTDDDLTRELRAARVDPADPDPSVETLVHATLPHAAVLHSHADAILTLTNSPLRDRVRELPGVLVVDYAMPGVDLAAAVTRAWASHGSQDIRGIVVLQHGLFTFAETPRAAYEAHIEIVSAAAAIRDAALREASTAPETTGPGFDTDMPLSELAALRARVTGVVGHPVVLRRDTSDETRAFIAHHLDAARCGPLTPDHVIHTRRVPCAGTDIEGYAAEYRTYFEANRDRRGAPLTALDPGPRVILDPHLGMVTIGPDARGADAVADIYRHTMRVIADCEALGGYDPASAGHVFDLEYWAIQQEKLTRGVTPLPLDGQIALVTGAASGIGKACAAALLDAGATVVGWDLSESVADTFETPEWIGQQVDVADPACVRTALREAVEAVGGIDIVVVGAGIFPTSADLGEMDMDVWRRTMAVNVDSVADLYGLVHPLLEHAPSGGRVVVIASKNVLAPGRGAAAYSSSKAALTQLSRVAALEWAGKGIRVNMVHPDAVFDTGLWTPDLLAARAEHYGLSVDEYKRRNLLHAEVTSATVGSLVLAMATTPFSCTTGAQVPIDGGSDRVI